MSGLRRASVPARALDHLAHARMLAANRRHPRFEARHRFAGAEEKVPDVQSPMKANRRLKSLASASYDSNERR